MLLAPPYRRQSYHPHQTSLPSSPSSSPLQPRQFQLQQLQLQPQQQQPTSIYAPLYTEHRTEPQQPDVRSQLQQQQQQDQYLAYSQHSTPSVLTQRTHNSNQSSSPLPQQDEQFNLANYPTLSWYNPDCLRIQGHTPSGPGQDPEPMQSDYSGAPSSWQFTTGQLTPASARSYHNRESSLSSVGSTGPSSPFTHNTLQPHVVPPDSDTEYYDGVSNADQAAFRFLKTPSYIQDSYLAPIFQHHHLNSSHPHKLDSNYAGVITMQDYQTALGPELMPAPEFAHSSRPSVASTHESPTTPSVGEDFEDHGRRLDYNSRNAGTIPKLDRTMSDAYNDELYSPNFSFTSTPLVKSEATSMLSPSHSDIFTQRLQAANNQHLSASQLPLLNQSRGRSPFQQGSSLAPISNSFPPPSSSPSQIRLGSAQAMREQMKAESDAQALQQQLQRNSPSQTAPNTISPKDALLDYHQTEEDSALPLFPEVMTQFKPHRESVRETQSTIEDNGSEQSFGSMATSRRESSSAYSTSSQATQQPGTGFTFIPPAVPRVQIPQQYPFVPQQRRQASVVSSVADRTPEFPSTLTSMDSSNSEYNPDIVDAQKPSGSNADSGTYTCTYHGCTLRFESPSKLQKHKREGHRQSAPLIGSGVSASVEGNSDGGSGMTSAALLRNSQAGPHKCARINPSTGKPCNTIFSRPYDLTRHEDTIHNARKQKVRCHLCTEEKTFSRNDALTRHMRVVHPEVDFPGKTRRRGHE